MRTRLAPSAGVLILAAVGTLGAAITPGATQLFGSGKPSIPDRPVLDTYSQTVSKEKLTIAPVTAGLGPVGDASQAEMLGTGINPALYRQTLQGLQSYIVAIAKAGPRPDVVPRVRFKLDDRPNAFAVSEEEIQLTTGMYKKINDNLAKDPEAIQQLLFILSHEYGHILYDHPQLYAKKSTDVGIAKVATPAIGIATAMNQVSAATGGGTVADRKAMGTMQAALALSPVIETEFYRVVYGPYQREQESLVDFAASDLMTKLKRGDPRDASGILTVFETYDNSLVGQLKAGLKNLGDAFKRSMDELRATALATMMRSGPSAVLQRAEQSFLKAIFASVGEMFLRRFNRNSVHLHYSAERRVDGVKLYSDKFYPREASAASAETLAAWAGRNNVTSPSQLVATFEREYGPDEAASEARLMLLSQDVAGARKIMDAAKVKYAAPARAPAPAKPAAKKGKGGAAKKPAAPAAPSPPAEPTGIRSTFFHFVDAQIYTFAGDTPNAIAAYKRAIALPEVSSKIYLDLAALQDLAGDGSAALATLDQGGAKFGEEAVIVAKIRHHAALNQMELATALVTRCAAFPRLAKECSAAIPSDHDSDDDDLLGSD